ncbi:hypothetical protein QUF58_12280 [Anaerolineales bacterium HSG24]|nr:hypothetical protein [Anaerolineales bacterium HSG24]
MTNIDKRNRFAEQVFTYRISKDNKVFISWYGKLVMILKGQKAKRFIRRVEGVDDRTAQLEMARITGNFKRGNE